MGSTASGSWENYHVGDEHKSNATLSLK
jgi:hypothetical protein